MKVIYSLSHQPDWIGFAREMKSRLGWEPQYWLTSAVTDPLVKENFPDCVRHKFPDIIQGNPPEEVNLYRSSAVDENTIREYAFEMDQAIKMMDRLDSGDAFSYNERKRYFTKILNYAHNVLERFGPEVAVFTETPHHATQYILFTVLKKHGVKTIMFKPVYIYSLRLLIYNDIHDDPFKTMERVDLQAQPDRETEKKIEEYITRLKSDYSIAVPDYMKKVIQTPSHSLTFVRTIFRLFRYDSILNLVNRKKSTNTLKLRGQTIEASVPNRLQLYWIKFRGSLKKRKLKKMYDRLVTRQPDLTKPFVFVPLQYQPERTSSPDGGAYVDQFLMINLLRHSLPSTVSILVKEHAAQFHPRMDGHLGRFEFNYRDLSALPNVHLIPETYSSFELIDKCMSLATITGTGGLEAVARKKPVLVFGAGCWYRSLPGVFYTPNAQSLQDALAEIQRGYLFKEIDIFDFLKKFHRISFEAKLTPQYPVDIESTENILNLAGAVEKYVQEVFARS